MDGETENAPVQETEDRPETTEDETPTPEHTPEPTPALTAEQIEEASYRGFSRALKEREEKRKKKIADIKASRNKPQVPKPAPVVKKHSWI